MVGLQVQTRLARPSVFTACRQCLRKQPSQISRPLTSSTAVNADAPSGNRQGGLSRNDPQFTSLSSLFASTATPKFVNPLQGEELDEWKPTTHHLHVYATKHNTHITFTNPDKNPILSLSAGNLSFRKSARGTYDAAYQLAAYVLAQIMERGLLKDIKEVEVVLRGFGEGRTAVTRAILGNEGRMLRPKISKVSDATRLKFGGTRSKKPRRLG